jgi:hypothetical protein
MIQRNSVVKLACATCTQLSLALNDKSDAEVRAWGERHGWRSIGDRDWCPGCVLLGRAKP